MIILKKILFIISILLIFSLSACGIETAAQHESRLNKEAESIKELQTSTTTTQESTNIASDQQQQSTAAPKTDGKNTSSPTVQQSTTQSLNNSSQGNTPPPAATTIKVYLTVKCTKILGHPQLKTNASIPSDGIMLARTQIIINEGSTVLDVMKAAQALNKITFTLKSQKSGYIDSINGLYEKSLGTGIDESGWKYRLNSEYPSSANQVTVNENDEIVWFYALTANDKDN